MSGLTTENILLLGALGIGGYFLLSQGPLGKTLDKASNLANNLLEKAGQGINAVDNLIGKGGVAVNAVTELIKTPEKVLELPIIGAPIASVKQQVDSSVNVGAGVVLVPSGCPPGFRNDGLTCFKDGGIRTYECGRLRGAFGEDWGPKWCTDTWAPEMKTQSLGCPAGRENVDGLCYNPCPEGKSRVPGMPYLCR